MIESSKVTANFITMFLTYSYRVCLRVLYLTYVINKGYLVDISRIRRKAFPCSSYVVNRVIGASH